MYDVSVYVVYVRYDRLWRISPAIPNGALPLRHLAYLASEVVRCAEMSSARDIIVYVRYDRVLSMYDMIVYVRYDRLYTISLCMDDIHDVRYGRLCAI